MVREKGERKREAGEVSKGSCRPTLFKLGEFDDLPWVFECPVYHKKMVDLQIVSKTWG